MPQNRTFDPKIDKRAPTVTVKLSEAENQAARLMAKENGESPSSFLRNLIRRTIRAHRFD
jgi:hypothetical protein